MFFQFKTNRYYYSIRKKLCKNQKICFSVLIDEREFLYSKYLAKFSENYKVNSSFNSSTVTFAKRLIETICYAKLYWCTGVFFSFFFWYADRYLR